MRLESKFKVSRLAKYALFIYVMLSVFFVTTHYFSSHYVKQTSSSTALAAEANSRIGTQQDQQVVAAIIGEDGQPPLVINEALTEKLPSFSKDTLGHDKEGEDNSNIQPPVIWPGVRGSEATHKISEQLIKSKIFSSSMGLDNVTPYYFKASHINTAQDITLATLVTRNRFQVLSRLATNYKGPISAAIHVLDDAEKLSTIRELGKIYSSNPDMQKYVDVHLIIDKFDRQFNMWRNIAKLFTRTDYLMMLDVDFHLCTDFRKTIFSDKNIHNKLATGKTALVVPAFEYLNQKDGMDWRTFPTKKTQVIEQVTQQGKLGSFHSSWPAGHGATNYTRWYEANEVYPVTEYEYSYEPYIIYKKENTPWCDERFIGYGANKAACLYEIFISGVDYWVLPHDFLIHQSHKYANHDRTRERVHNKELYENFRTEICLRYSRKYVIEDTWYTPAADNMKKVCTNIPKWKYLSGISKEQRLKDLAEEEAVKAAAAAFQQKDIDIEDNSDQQSMTEDSFEEAETATEAPEVLEEEIMKEVIATI